MLSFMSGGKKQCAMPAPNFIQKNQLEGNKRWPISRKKLTFRTYRACHEVNIQCVLQAWGVTC